MKTRHFGLAVSVSWVALVGCGDDPFTIKWSENPDTVRLHALSRPEPNLFSAFDFHSRVAKRLEAVSTGILWDVVTDVQDDGFVWLPPGSLDISSDAALAILEGETFESAARAPSDTARYLKDRPIPIEAERIYVVRTRRIQGSFSACNYYGKIEVLEMDRIGGMIRFRFDLNPVCNDPALIPPD